MSLLKNIQNGNNWNIGFCDLAPEDFIANRKLGKIRWMKHDYNDRFFADPFILKADEKEIIVFAEEYIFDQPPGRIVELVIDRESKCLKQRYVLLELPTHLSYPAILKTSDGISVYPENGQSGCLNIYRYDSKSHKLVEPRRLINEPVADATIYRSVDGKYLMAATKYPDNQQDCFLFETSNLSDGFVPVSEAPFETSRACSRPAGNFFEAGGKVYRPAQDCSAHYGGGLSIMDFDAESGTEKFLFKVESQSYKYSRGIHTINFADGLCVVDGLGFYYPTVGRIYASKTVETMRTSLKRLFKFGR